MATDQVQPEIAEPRSGGCLKGCLIIFVILLVIAVIVGIFLYMYGRPVIANFYYSEFAKQVDATSLPAEEKEESKTEFKRLTDAFAEDRVSANGIQNAVIALAQSSIFQMLIVSSVEVPHLEQSGLGDEEKADGKVTIGRFNNGLADRTIDQSAIDQTLQHVAIQGAQGNWQLKPTLTDDELRAFLADAKAAADAAEVPLEPRPIDLSAEIKKIVDMAFEVGDQATAEEVVGDQEAPEVEAGPALPAE